MSIAYEQPITTYWTIETPLNEQFEFETPIVIDKADLPVDDLLSQRMTLILVVVLVGIILFALLVIPRLVMTSKTQSDSLAIQTSAQTAVLGSAGSISPIFSPEVQQWAPQIIRWANEHSLDPNIVATIMQIESCGDPQALSVAGAQGLFQVMPFHFAAGENAFDPKTNARRGMAYFAERLEQTAGDVGRAFAGYNGGHVAAGSSWEQWPDETQRYYVWSTGIYADAKAGLSESPTLAQWLAAGGATLCRQAANRLGLE
jgi:hypothetical protein